MAADGEGRALRHALLLAGLDHWGQAWSRVYGAGAMSGLSGLIGLLRDALDPVAEAAVQAALRRIDGDEAAAFAFKAETHKSIAVALWHALIADDSRDSATGTANELGSLLLGLLRALPENGWVIVASALADIQIRCLAHGLAQEGLAQEMTQQVFAALAQALPAEERKRILGGAGQAVLAWQQARRETAH